MYIFISSCVVLCDPLVSLTEQLILCCRWGEVNQVILLIEQHNINLNNSIKDEFKRPLLNITVKGGNLEIVRFLIHKGICLNELDQNGNTALHEAAIGNHIKCVFALIIAGANLNIKNKHGFSACDLAKKRGKTGIALALDDASSCEDQTKWSPNELDLRLRKRHMEEKIAEARRLFDLEEREARNRAMEAAVEAAKAAEEAEVQGDPHPQRPTDELTEEQSIQ